MLVTRQERVYAICCDKCGKEAAASRERYGEDSVREKAFDSNFIHLLAYRKLDGAIDEQNLWLCKSCGDLVLNVES